MYFHSPLASPPSVRAPQTRMLPFSSRMQLMPSGIEPVLVRLWLIAMLHAQRAAHDLVGRRLVHAALVVDARVDAGDVAARRHEASPVPARVLELFRRVEDRDPRVVERRVFRRAVGSMASVGGASPGCRRSRSGRPSRSQWSRTALRTAGSTLPGTATIAISSMASNFSSAPT